ncbi:MAG: pyrroline-5-carboxylate reductase [Clostridia bacterium]|nr:pyrroline-5-carboxylate reductase [Clostridia bacterium]
MHKIGFVGSGKMAGAIMGALLRNGHDPKLLTVSDPVPEALVRPQEAGATTTSDNRTVFERSDIIFIAVKPQSMRDALGEIGSAAEGKTIVTMMAGIRSEQVAELCPGAACVIRMMPNTPMLVNKGTIAVALGDAPIACAEAVEAILATAGSVYRVDETAMDAVTALSGSGPAYFYRIAAVMAETAAQYGIDPKTAVQMAAGTMAGAAEMLVQSGKTPAELIRDVSSAKGTTVAALEAFDRASLDEAIRAGVEAAWVRSRELSQGK